jgi:hypothetical protein
VWQTQCYGTKNVDLLILSLHHYINSIFFFLILLILPRTVEMMLGGEPQAPGYEINEFAEQETSDDESTSQH